MNPTDRVNRIHIKLIDGKALEKEEESEVVEYIKKIFKSLNDSSSEFKLDNITYKKKNVYANLADLTRRVLKIHDFDQEDATSILSGLDKLKSDSKVKKYDIREAKTLLTLKTHFPESGVDSGKELVQEIAETLSLAMKTVQKEATELQNQKEIQDKKSNIKAKVTAGIVGGLSIPILVISFFLGPAGLFIGVGIVLLLFLLGVFVVFGSTKEEIKIDDQLQKKVDAFDFLNKNFQYTKEKPFKNFIEKNKEMLEKIKNNPNDLIQYLNSYGSQKHLWEFY